MNAETAQTPANLPRKGRGPHFGWRTWVALGTAGLILLAVAGTALLRPAPAPLLRGKPLDVRVRQLMSTRAEREEAEAAFRNAGPEVAPPLVRILNRRDAFSRKLLEWAEALPAPAQHWLYRRLRTHAVAVERAGAATALGLVGDTRPEVLDALARAMQDEDTRIRVAAVISLAALGPPGGRRLLAELPQLKGRIRHLALGALSPANAPPEPAVTALLEEALHGIHLVPLNTCAEAISRFGPAAVPVVFALLADSGPDATGRDNARLVLVQVAKNNYPFLKEWIRLLPEQPPAVRRFALEVLNGFARHIATRAVAFARALRDPDPEVRRLAKQGLLKQLPSPAVRHAVPLLRAALEDENPEVRQAAKEVLERMGNPEIRIPKSEK